MGAGTSLGRYAGLGGFGDRLAGGMAGALAGGAARSLTDGTDFGDNVLAALPDVIGNTIGEWAAGTVAAGYVAERVSTGPRYLVQPEDQNGNPIPSEPDIIVTGHRMTWYEKIAYDADRLVGGITNAIMNPRPARATIVREVNPTPRAAVANAVASIQRFDRAHPGVLARMDAERRAGEARAAQALGTFDRQVAGMVLGPPLIGLSGATLLVGGGVTTTLLAADGAVTGTRATLTGNFRSVGAEVINRGTGTGQNGRFGAGDAAVLAGGVYSLGRVGVSLLTARSAPAVGGAPSLEDLYWGKYQSLYEEGLRIVQRDISAGEIQAPVGQPAHLFEANRIDAYARDNLKLFAEIEDHGTDFVRINQRLYLDSGRYRVPDIYFPQSGTILDGTLGFKTARTPQIADFRTANNNAPIVIVRPTRYGGSYQIDQ